MKTLIFLTICLAVSAEPAKLTILRKHYLRSVQKIDAERDEKIRAVTKKYIQTLNALKVAQTRKGDLEGALAMRAEIEAIRPVLEPGKTTETMSAVEGHRVDKIVLYQTTNGRFGDVGTKRGTVVIYRGDKEVFRKRFSMTWRPGRTTSVKIKLVRPLAGVTRVLVECDKNRSKALLYVGLAEIEVYVGKENIARQAKITANSMFNSNHKVANLIDGVTDSSLGPGGNWATRTPDGWVSLTWAK